MRHVLQAIAAALVAAAVIAVLDVPSARALRASLVSVNRRAQTTTSTSTVTTTSTSSTTVTSSTSTSTTTSTSTSTTTSTSTSTTSSTVPGDVSQDASWVGIYYVEEATPSSTNLADSSAATNPLSSGNCANGTTNTSEFIQGIASLTMPAGTLSCRFNCDSGNGCTDSEFFFGGASDDFTVFTMLRPTVAGTAVRAIMGTDDHNGVVPPEPGGWALYTNASFQVCFQTEDSAETESPEICDTTALSINTWYSIAVTYDGSDDDAWLEVDGTQVATSASMLQPDNTQALETFALGDFNTYAGGTSNQVTGEYDQVAVFAGHMTQAWRTRIQVCLIDGSACSCNNNSPTLYVSRPRHTSQGGPIAGPMPDCNDLTIDVE